MHYDAFTNNEQGLSIVDWDRNKSRQNGDYGKAL